MSKYSKEMEEMFKDVESLKKATKDVIKDGGELAFKKWHEETSYERLKKEVMK